MHLGKTVNLIIALALLPLNGVAYASRPNSRSESPLRLQVTASKVAIFYDGAPVCQASLADQSELTPNFVKVNPDPIEIDAGPLGALRPCEGKELTSIAQMASLLNFRNQVAAGPLALIPVVVCAAGIAIGAWAGNLSGELQIQDSRQLAYSIMGATASTQSLATVATGTFSKIVPVPYAAVYGGFIGAMCGLVGQSLGYVYFRSKASK